MSTVVGRTGAASSGDSGQAQPREALLGARPRALVDELPPYVPGRPAEEVRRIYGLTDVVKLASNENPFGPSPLAVEAMSRVVGGVNYYPDGAALALRDRLAASFDLHRANIAVGNGSDEVILLLALAYLDSGAEAVLASPPYGIHRRAILTAGATPVAVPLRDGTHDLDAMAAACGPRTRLVFVANPHNPTGTTVTREAMRAFAARVPAHALLVVDEAYYDFVDDDLRWTGRELLAEYPNIVTLRTFSKAHGLAGLRAGYAVAHSEVGRVLDRIRPPFGLNLVAQAAALAAIDDEAHVARVVAETRQGRTRLLAVASQHGLRAIPSQANFVLIEVPDSMAVSEALLRRGIIVRPGENLGIPGWIRVSVGTPRDLDSFAQALGPALHDAASAPAAGG